jgi:hypothetical protein
MRSSNMRINPKSGLLVVLTALLTIALSGGAVAAAQEDQMGCTLPEGDAVTIADAKLYIEYMSTDGDLGVHGLFDDHGWSELCVTIRVEH